MSWRPDRLVPKSSILLQLLVGGFAVTTLVMAGGGATSYYLVKKSWIEQIDRSLESRALGIATACHRTENGVEFDGSTLDRSIFQDPHSLEYFEVRDAQGRTLGRSASLGGASFPKDLPQPDSQRFGWFHPPTLHRMRYVSGTFALPQGRMPGKPALTTVFFGQDFRDAKNRLRVVRWRFFLVWFAAEILMSGFLFLLVRSSLEPLGKLAGRLREVDENSRGRFADLPVPVEVAPLVKALDGTLGRLSAAFRRERTLLADLAHELRTPLSGLRTTLEVGVDDVEVEARSAMRRGLSIAVGMQSLMESLMALARLEGRQIQPVLAQIELLPTLEELWRPHAQAAQLRGSTAVLRIEPGLAVRADREWFSIVVRNLLENAVHHAAGGSRIECSARKDPDMVALLVRNDGSELEESDLPRVFDRFWRRDAVRKGGHGHAGLGLPLSRELVLHMGGTIEARIPEKGVFEVELRLLPA